MTIDWKAWLSSKTFWLAIIEALVGTAAFIKSNPLEGGIALALAIATIIIRAFTNTAIKGTPAAKAPGTCIKQTKK